MVMRAKLQVMPITVPCPPPPHYAKTGLVVMFLAICVVVMKLGMQG